ncbi:MAG: bifunctional precorrin-2 dehydrogenase/sirohydrochlorin ferrochelatase [Candidatus Omnitrophota bacterium]|nr:bifunctional precorrin-2 dehydrogenase/sirohydrochlorin ferrochelatase [Candidatus Omnitrophota bacterium]
MKYYPVNLALENKKCVVFGAGIVALRKVNRLLECGARVSVIAEEIVPELKKLFEEKKIVFKNKRFDLKDLARAFLVVAATDNRKLNARVCDYCLKRNILVNVVDSPSECNFILPSVLRRGSLSISVSTDGVSPALAKKIRRDIQQRFGFEYAKLLRLMQKIRPEALKKIKNPRARNLLFKKIFQPKILGFFKKNKQRQANKRVRGYLKNAQR